MNEDATDPGSYRGVAPANIVMMCRMLGLVDLPELPNVVRAMQALCAHKRHVVWTRRLDWRDGADTRRHFGSSWRRPDSGTPH